MRSAIIWSFTGAIDTPSPVISVVMPWVILLAARLSTSTLNSDWPSRSMKPGATTSPAASMRVVAWASASRPIAVIRSAVMPTSPRNQGAPVPSTIRPLAMTTSKRVGCAVAAAEAGAGGVVAGVGGVEGVPQAASASTLRSASRPDR